MRMVCFLFYSLLTLVPGLQSCSQKEEAAEEIFTERGFVEMSDGVKLHYSRFGDGPQNLIIPAALYLEEDLKELATKDRSIIFYDMRNRGQSEYVTDSTTLTIQQDVKDLEEIRQHFGFQSTSLLGYSYLGFMVILYAKDYPDRINRIIQMGPVPRKFGTPYPAQFTANDASPVLDTAALARVNRLADEGFHESNPQQFCQDYWEVTKYYLVGDPGNASKLRSVCHLSNEWPVNLWRHFSFHFAATQKIDIPWSELLIDKPVLIFHGTKDRNAPYGSGREWAFRLPNAKLITAQNAAHNVWIEYDVIKDMDQFLKGEWPAKAESVQNNPVEE